MFNQNRICCISDIHIGVHQNSAQWHDILFQWARWLKKELNNKGVTDIMICGDLFHYRDEISVNTLHATSRLLELWEDFNVVMLVGNHDAYYKERADVNSLSIFKNRRNVTIVDKTLSVNQGDKSLCMVPWGVEARDIPKCDIMFGHFEIQSFKLNNFKVCETGIHAKQLLEKSPLIITGHFHLRDEREYDDGKVLYLGNPFQMDFGDREGVKGYYLLDINECEYSFYVNNVSPEHKKINLSDLVSHGDITDEVRSMFKNNIIRLVIDRNISPDEVDILLKVLLSLGSMSLNVEYENTFNNFNNNANDNTDLSNVDMVTAIKEFVGLLDLENRDVILDKTLELYHNHNK